jgi:hypothetical protein
LSVERKQYPISYLHQMADIPKEALPRFIAELPSILASYRQIADAAEDIASVTPKPRWLFMLPLSAWQKIIARKLRAAEGASWVDDDKRMTTVRIFARDEIDPVFVKSLPMVEGGLK